MTGDHTPAVWHDLIHPATRHNPDAAIAVPAPPRPPVPAVPVRAVRRRASDPAAIRRRLTGHTIGHGLLAGVYIAVTVFLSWAVIVLTQHDAGPIIAAIGAMAATSALGAATHTLGAVTAVRARYDRRTTATAVVAVWSARLHLSVAVAGVVITAVRYPLAATIAFPTAFTATVSLTFLLNTRDIINRHRRDRPGGQLAAGPGHRRGRVTDAY